MDKCQIILAAALVCIMAHLELEDILAEIDDLNYVIPELTSAEQLAAETEEWTDEQPLVLFCDDCGAAIPACRLWITQSRTFTSARRSGADPAHLSRTVRYCKTSCSKAIFMPCVTEVGRWIRRHNNECVESALDRFYKHVQRAEAWSCKQADSWKKMFPDSNLI